MRPLCECHGEPMQARGGDRPFPWRCVVKQRTSNRKYADSARGYVTRRRRNLSAQRERITNRLKELRDGSQQG